VQHVRQTEIRLRDLNVHHIIQLLLLLLLLSKKPIILELLQVRPEAPNKVYGNVGGLFQGGCPN